MGTITCKVCGSQCHSIELHFRKTKHDITFDQYREKYPNEPLFSDVAVEYIKKEREKVEAVDSGLPMLKDVFCLEDTPEVKTKSGNYIRVHVLPENEEWKGLIPAFDKNYVFDVETLKNAVMAFELNIPLYLFGQTGVGKTELCENICAATNRPLLRVQHTVNTEESNIVGQWVAKGGETVFELGPLALAMKHGWVYLADEYDFAMPSVLAVYQPVLEGKALVIKEADAENRIIKPHPNFRFVATGNTNGTGDETGLYQGTAIQNAANYDRFNMVIEVKYMKPEKEIEVVKKQGNVNVAIAKLLVDFANRVREEYHGSKLSAPISPRTLIAIARIGFMKGDYKQGIQLAFSNKLSTVDREVVNGLSQRIFG